MRALNANGDTKIAARIVVVLPLLPSPCIHGGAQNADQQPRNALFQSSLVYDKQYDRARQLHRCDGFILCACVGAAYRHTLLLVYIRHLYRA